MTSLKAKVISRELGSWGFHDTCVNCDLSVEIEFSDDSTLPSARQRVMVFATADFDDDEGNPIPEISLATCAMKVVEDLNKRSEEAINAVIKAVGATRIDDTVTSINVIA